MLYQDQRKTLAEIGKFSQRDAEQWPKYEKYLREFCKFWDQNLDHMPYNYLKEPTFSDKVNFFRSSLPTRHGLF